MDKVTCCGNCFNDEKITKFISTGGDKNINCSFCQKKDTNCIAPKYLTHLFQPFTELYEESVDNTGKTLWELLTKDWLLFNSLSPEKRKNLLLSILPDYKLDERLFLPRGYVDEQIKKWATFTNELKFINRYFYLNSPDENPLKRMFSYLIREISLPTSFYRARISDDSKHIPIKKMEKPPKDKVGNGRANPIGISYLYTASDYETAIAEIRPHVGDYVCVGEFAISKSFKFIDIRNPRETISPFDVIEREGLLEDVIDNIEYLNKLGKELSKPVIPRDANLEYLSSQYICELIKHKNYDGVIYKSSVGDGDNYAIFDDKNLLGKKTSIYKITKNSYESKIL